MKNWQSSISSLLISIIAGAILTSGASAQGGKTSTAEKADAATPIRSAAYEWLDVALEATAREHQRVAPRPTVGSRMLMIITTCMYDAWAAYDDKAVGTRLGGKLRRPPAERTEKNKRTAIAFATYRAMLDLFPEDKAWLDEQMRQRGFDPDDSTTDLSKPQGVGNVADELCRPKPVTALRRFVWGRANRVHNNHIQSQTQRVISDLCCSAF